MLSAEVEKFEDWKVLDCSVSRGRWLSRIYGNEMENEENRGVEKRMVSLCK